MAVLYCFLNAEVQEVIKRRVVQTMLTHYDVKHGREVVGSKPVPLPKVEQGQNEMENNALEMVPLAERNSIHSTNVIKVELNHP